MSDGEPVKVEAVAVSTVADSSASVSAGELDVLQILGNNLDYIDDPLPGQKKPTPSPGSGIRVFYESLLNQNPDSYIALKWCVEHGVYPGAWEPTKANEILEEKKTHLKDHGYLPGREPGKSGAPSSSSSSSAPPKKRKKKSSGSNIIDSTAIAGELSGLGGGGWEAAGRSEL